MAAEGLPYRISYVHPTVAGIIASAVLTVLVIVGSRNLEHFDSALFGYTVASIVAFGAIVFRYAIWLQRPATRRYFRRELSFYFQKHSHAAMRSRRQLPKHSPQDTKSTKFALCAPRIFVLKSH
jgi:hypothetical protein